MSKKDNVEGALTRLLVAQREAIGWMRDTLPTIVSPEQREECEAQINDIASYLEASAPPAYLRVAAFLEGADFNARRFAVRVINSYRKVLDIFTNYLKAAMSSAMRVERIGFICEILHDAPRNLLWRLGCAKEAGV